MNYLFQSQRLGFRVWQAGDVGKMAAINADPEVMRFFPEPQTREQTAAFIARMKTEFAKKRFCYFAVDKLENGEFIGFIGLCEQTFKADFTPCIDIGWRLKKEAWNQGFATEGAKKCLDHAFNKLHLKKIYSMTPELNLRSERVMKKIGMKKTGCFKHPLLAGDKRLESCFLYEITNPTGDPIPFSLRPR